MILDKKKKEIAYIKSKGRYLIVPIEGETIILDSEEEFNKYLTDNNCKIIE